MKDLLKMQHRAINCDSIEMVDNIIRPNPFEINAHLYGNSEKKCIKRYGHAKTVIYGRLFEEDRGTLIALIKLSNGNYTEPFDVDFRDILKLKGLKNSYVKTSLKSVKKSIKRLLNTKLKIIPDINIKKKYKFYFLKGKIQRKYKARLSLIEYSNAIDTLKLGSAYIRPTSYFRIRGQIAKSLYVYLASQKYFYSESGYEIRLSKLCHYINYHKKDRYWSQIWQSMEPAFDHLMDLDIIEVYSRDRKRKKLDGGMITAAASKEGRAKKPEKEYYHQDLLDFIKDNFSKSKQILTIGMKESLDSALDELISDFPGNKFESEKMVEAYLDELSRGGTKFVSSKILTIDHPQWNRFKKRMQGEYYEY